MDKIKRICGNCEDYNKKLGTCTIRFTILADNKTRVPMTRKAGQLGCEVFMYEIKSECK